MNKINPHLEPKLSDSQTGFTLVELVIVIVVLGVMSAYATMKRSSPAEITLPSQAQKMASDIRHTQTLAYTWGKRMRLSVATPGANGTYRVICFAGTPACTTSNDFSVTLEKGIVLAGSTLYFNSLGQPSDSSGSPVASATSYTLGSSSDTETVSVAALTGLVTVTP